MFYVFVLTLFFYVTYELFLSDIKYIYIKQYNKRTYKRTKIEYQTKRKRRIYINSTHHYHGNEEIFDKNCWDPKNNGNIKADPKFLNVRDDHHRRRNPQKIIAMAAQ